MYRFSQLIRGHWQHPFWMRVGETFYKAILVDVEIVMTDPEFPVRQHSNRKDTARIYNYLLEQEQKVCFQDTVHSILHKN